MLKKLFIAASLALVVVATPAIANAQEGQKPAQTSEATAPAGEVVKEMPNGQAMVTTGAVDSKEVNTVEVSSTAQKMEKEEKAAKDKKMSQAEKAKNVEENDSWGGAITLIAMAIVLGALIILSIFFNIFGTISAKLLSKKKLEAQGKTADDVDENHEDVDSGEVIAAIAAALSEHFNDQHDVEDYILTIRRMRRAYSPWNSKIYNIRQTPDLSKNPARAIPVSKNIK